jgi:hypothetical protein
MELAEVNLGVKLLPTTWPVDFELIICVVSD